MRRSTSRLASREAISLIIQLCALGDRKLPFYPAILEVKLQWYEAVALYLRQGVELAYLALVQQQLALPEGIAIEYIALLIGANVHAYEVAFAVLYLRIGILQVDLAGPYALDLGADQSYSAMKYSWRAFRFSATLLVPFAMAKTVASLLALRSFYFITVSASCRAVSAPLCALSGRFMGFFLY